MNNYNLTSEEFEDIYLPSSDSEDDDRFFFLNVDLRKWCLDQAIKVKLDNGADELPLAQKYYEFVIQTGEYASQESVEDTEV